MSAVVVDSEALSQLANHGRREKAICAVLDVASNTKTMVTVPAAVLQSSPATVIRNGGGAVLTHDANDLGALCAVRWNPYRVDLASVALDWC